MIGKICIRYITHAPVHGYRANSPGGTFFFIYLLHKRQKVNCWIDNETGGVVVDCLMCTISLFLGQKFVGLRKWWVRDCLNTRSQSSWDKEGILFCSFTEVKGAGYKLCLVKAVTRGWGRGEPPSCNHWFSMKEVMFIMEKLTNIFKSSRCTTGQDCNGWSPQKSVRLKKVLCFRHCSFAPYFNGFSVIFLSIYKFLKNN